ncbi:UNVERIFIED_CONTAM: Serine carboxypeptidase-like 18 [Sesamum latifolium]|uniref:Serine carboxypeptidase-like 18 n=1 Tax=Sesamum latifolium TaxID=2727402 RepID=A0AAW2UYG1_9LAMI
MKLNYYSSLIHSLILCFLLLINTNPITTASSQFIISTLPGYPAGTPLPFKLETGERPSKRSSHTVARRGPGCSGFSALIYEIGPLAFDVEGFDGSFASFSLNPYSWTKIANIIFIDYPAGAGFSYATTSQGYNNSDTKSAEYNYLFMRKWLLNHPEFVRNRLYVAGDSYGGKIVPMVALEIAKGNEAGFEPRMSIQGYIVGNSITHANEDHNEILPYAHRMALISDEYFELARSSCHGEYFENADPENAQCIYALQLVQECTSHLNHDHILEPKCNVDDKSPRPNVSWSGQLFLGMILLTSFPCPNKSNHGAE